MPIISSGVLYSPLHGGNQDYQVYQGESDKFAPIVKETWQGLLLSKVFTAKSEGLDKAGLIQFISDQGIEDFHWNWEAITLKHVNPVDYVEETFYLVSLNRVQGIVHAYIPKPSRLNHSDFVVYVDRIAVAPWNRDSHPGEKELKGVGSCLMQFICSYSDNNGYKGCVGLHSLPQAETFYDKIGMTCLGEDTAYDRLKYFEFDIGDGSSFGKGAQQ